MADPAQLASPEAAVSSKALEYGILGVVCLIFAYVIVFLYKRNERIRDAAEAKSKEDDKLIATERLTWALERERWSVEREKIRADLAEKFARELRDAHEQSRAHEVAIRREYAEMIEGMSNEQKRASDALVDMLRKFHERALAAPASPTPKIGR